MSELGPLLASGSGVAEADVALTWLVLAAAELGEAGVRAAAGAAMRRVSLRAFLGHFELARVRAVLAVVAVWKCEERNMWPAEIAAMRRLSSTSPPR